ncbi:MAG: UbiA family prenyltransferase [Elusimicrobiota bacterium]
MMEFAKRIIDTVERIKIGWSWLVATLFSIILIRNLLEVALEYGGKTGQFSYAGSLTIRALLHYPIFYIAILLGLVLILRLSTSESLKNIFKVTTVGWTLTWIVPIIDYIISGGRGYTLNYAITLKSFILGLLFFFSPFHSGSGVSPGMRIEVGLACIFIAIYVMAKTHKFYKTLGAFIGFYFLIIFSASLPVFFAELMVLLPFFERTIYLPFYQVFYMTDFSLAQRMVTLIFLLFSSFLLFWLLCLYDRKKWQSMICNIRGVRSLYYMGMAAFGIILGYLFLPEQAGSKFITHPLDILKIVGLLSSGFLAWQFAKIFNDIFDYDADIISGNHTPLTDNAISFKQYQIIGVICLILSLLMAFTVHYSTFYLMLFVCIISFLYSVPPLRLKRVFLLSTFIIAMSGLIAIMVGFSFFAKENTLWKFPAVISKLIIFCILIGFHAKDLKDIEGDRKQRILTLPVLLGPQKGRIVIGLLVLVGYFLVPLILKANILFIPALILGLLSFFITMKLHKPDTLLLFIYAFIFIPIVVYYIILNIEKFR